MDVISVLAEARRTKKWTQAALATAAGISRMTVQRIEARTLDPRMDTVMRMANALGYALRADVLQASAQPAHG